MSRRSYLRNLLQQLNILSAAPEFIVADKCPEWSATENSEFLFVNLLEERALIEFKRTLQIPQQISLRDVQQLDLEHFAGFAVDDQVSDAGPCGFQLLERGVMKDLVQLQRDQSVDIRNARSNRRLCIAGQGHVPFKNLVDELLHHVLAALLGKGILAKAALGHNLVQQRHFSGLCFSGLPRQRIRRATHSCPPLPWHRSRSAASSVLPSLKLRRTVLDQVCHFLASFPASLKAVSADRVTP